MKHFARIAIGLAALFVAAILAVSVRAATITLKDGTVLVGSMTRQEGGYQITTADGNTRTVSDDDIASIGTGNAPSAAETPAVSGSDEFNVAKRKADGSRTVMAAVDAWQRFMEKNPNSPDLPAAKEEMARWQKLAAGNAEKINGKWIGGQELHDMQRRSDDLTNQARELWTHSQTLQAIDKLHEAVKIYPNSFVANYALGYLSMVLRNYDDAIDYFQTTVRLTPNSPEALNNLAVAHFFRRHFEEGIEGLEKAVEIQDTKMIAQNLVTAMSVAPPDIRSTPRFNHVRQTATLMSMKYHLSGPSEWMLIEPPEHKAADGTVLPPSVVAGGSGFLVSDDGLILTNRHVVKAGNIFMVICGKKRYSADVVAVDDQYDLAMLRIKADVKLPFVHLSPTDSPPDGAECTVIGYPLMFDMGLNPKITHGIVSSGSQNVEVGADVLIDATVNHGNSGGPILDRYGNVIAMVCLKAFSGGDQESYGVGISAGHIREFLDRQHKTLDAGELGDVMSAEQVVAKVKPATVCILVSK